MVRRVWKVVFSAVFLLLSAYFVLRGFSARGSADTSDHVTNVVPSTTDTAARHYLHGDFSMKAVVTEMTREGGDPAKDKEKGMGGAGDSNPTVKSFSETRTSGPVLKPGRYSYSEYGLTDRADEVLYSSFLEDRPALLSDDRENLPSSTSNNSFAMPSNNSPPTDITSDSSFDRSPGNAGLSAVVAKIRDEPPAERQSWFWSRSRGVRQHTGRGPRYLVYYCDSSRHCGGWADRQRGLLSVFLLANVTERRFKVDMRSPCNLTNFFLPVNEDWWIEEETSSRAWRATLDDMSQPTLTRVLRAGQDFNSLFPQTVVQVRTNRDLVPDLRRHSLYRLLLPTWAMSASKGSRFRAGWRLLAAPSPSLTSHLLTHVKPLWPSGSFPDRLDVDRPAFGSNTTLLCAHVRIGRNPTIPNDNVRNDPAVADVMLAFLDSLRLRAGDSARVFVATDDQAVRVAARKRFGDRLLDHGGKIVHIDRQGEKLDACAGFESAVLDQLILSACHVLIMSRSGFSLHAAYLRQQQGGLFILRNGSVQECGLEFD